MNKNISTIFKQTTPGNEPVDAPVREPRKPDFQARFAGIFPWLLVLGFLGLLALTFGERLLPARSLAVTTVVSLQNTEDTAGAPGNAGVTANTTATTLPAPAQVDPYEGAMLFQASGWIEPDPYPINATALISGVVETVEVLEGESVSRGQVLATLIDDDAELDVRTAQHQLQALKAQAAVHDQKIAAIQARVETLDKRVEAARARQEELADPARRLEQITERVVPKQEIAQARLALETQKAEVAALEAQRRELQAEEQGAEQAAEEYDARIEEAATQLARAELALERTRILSPLDGMVTQLMAAPGQKKMLGGEDPHSATIAVLFDPEHLQARIDVPLAEAGQLEVGQPVRLRSNILPDQTFQGTVTRIVGEADLQRNTLQAKVAIHNPDPRLRPEMLCRAEFLTMPPSSGPAPETAVAGSNAVSATDGRGSPVQIFIPQGALVDQEESTATVWKLDSTENRVTAQTVQLGAPPRDGHLPVLSGLKPGDRVVLDPPADLSPGQRVNAKEPAHADL